MTELLEREAILERLEAELSERINEQLRRAESVVFEESGVVRPGVYSPTYYMVDQNGEMHAYFPFDALRDALAPLGGRRARVRIEVEALERGRCLLPIDDEQTSR